MIQKHPFHTDSCEQLEFLLNHVPAAVIVSLEESRELVYANDQACRLFAGTDWKPGITCWQAMGYDGPCPFCRKDIEASPGDKKLPDGAEAVCSIGGLRGMQSCQLSRRQTVWDGKPACIEYITGVTAAKVEAQPKEAAGCREEYFQTMVKKLSGGVAVVRYHRDGRKVPEYFSDGFAVMCGMTMDEVWQLYGKDGMAGVHPEDCGQLNARLEAFLAGGEEHCELIYRLRKGDGSYLWVKNHVSMLRRGDGEYILYASYHDMTTVREDQERIRRQYRELILQHYRTPVPNALIIGHCNITRSRILEISDYTGANLLERFGEEREAFFTGISGLVADKKERREFLDIFLNKPTLAAFAAGKTEQRLDCFIMLPGEACGRYVRFVVSLVKTPDTGDITGILTVSDITEQTVSDKNLHQLSASGYDLVADIDLLNNTSALLSGSPDAGDASKAAGRHSDCVAFMLQKQVVPRDKEYVAERMDPEYMRKHLKKDGDTYSFSYSIMDDRGEILAKKLTVLATDLRLSRFCLARADITDSVREQQGLLNVVAYTFEMLGLIHIGRRHIILYTRQTVLQALPPVRQDYDSWLRGIKEVYIPEGGPDEVEGGFGLQHMRRHLEERPEGYDFVMPCRAADGPRYKQINVLWGDREHKTICIVRQDVTEMLKAERKSKEDLERALALAEEASRSKSDFLSSMSHDIRTPMNAIMGMTALAEAHRDDRDRVAECLRTISLSSHHLLSLINDILDMSKIERSKITLNHGVIVISDLVEHLASMMEPQAKEAGLHFEVRTARLLHPCFYGDSLRINQILINILSNAIKFTPEGGTVKFLTEETGFDETTQLAGYRFTITDTGLGMSKAFLDHLFEPFTRSGNTARIEGTGLGLSITKGLVDLMKGRITVESTEQSGSSFRVELECEVAGEEGKADTDADKRAAAAAKDNGIAGCRYLVAEDNEINAEILSELLQLYGAKAVVRTNGKLAVQEFRRMPPGTFDAVLMDIQMPEMNGYEAAREIRKLDRPDAAGIPVIAMTANAFTEDIQAALEAGMTAHIAKPIDVQNLVETLVKYGGR